MRYKSTNICQTQCTIGNTSMQNLQKYDLELFAGVVGRRVAPRSIKLCKQNSEKSILEPKKVPQCQRFEIGRKRLNMKTKTYAEQVPKNDADMGQTK